MAVDDIFLLVGTNGAPPARSSLAPSLKKMANFETPERACATTPSLSFLLQKTAKRVLSYRPGLQASAACADVTKFSEHRRQVLELRMSNAESVAQWEEAARELDQLEGNDVWKDDPATGDYSASLIESRLRELDAARANCDVREMLFLLRNTLSRDLGGMGSADLYRYSYTGTKRIIERYVESAVKTVEALVQRSEGVLPKGMRHQDVYDELVDTRQNFGRSALMLSGGATYGMTHIGVVKALFQAKLLPRVISGASAGSIICAVLCTKTDEEVPAVLETFPYGDLAVFEEADSDETIASHIRKLLTEGSWSDIKHLTRVMRGLLGDITFQEAYNRTRRICNITVSTASIFELPRLLNYYTAPDVMIWSAVVVSCSVPVLFQPSHLLVKDPLTGEHIPWNPSPQRWIDGSVDNDLPTARLAEMFSVNHFIVSQVNPHVVPFLTRDDRPLSLEERAAHASSAHGSHGKSFYSTCKSIVSTVTVLAKDEALYRLNLAAELGIFSNLFTKLASIMSQKYSGDITIIPDINFQDLPRILKNPTTDFMLRSCLIGEKATWPQLRRIRDHCAIELAIDRAIHDLRTRAAFSPSQVNLRRMGNCAIAGEVGQPVTKLHHRERRRSGGSLQLLVRQRQNRGELEQIMTDNESRLDEGDGVDDSSVGPDSSCPSDDEDDEGMVLVLGGARKGGPRRTRVSSVASSSAGSSQTHHHGAGSTSGGGGGGGGLLKPVLRRATRSHNALPTAVRSKLSTTMCISPTAYDPPVLLGADSLASDFIRVDRSASTSPSLASLPMSRASSQPSPIVIPAASTTDINGDISGARTAAVSTPRLSSSLLILPPLRSPSQSPSPSPTTTATTTTTTKTLTLVPQPAPSPTPAPAPARLEIASPTDETTLADSSVFDADVDDSQSEGNSVSDPDLDGRATTTAPSPPLPSGEEKEQQEQQQQGKAKAKDEQDSRSSSQSQPLLLDGEVSVGEGVENRDPVDEGANGSLWD